jgi:hypothetical protein
LVQQVVNIAEEVKRVSQRHFEVEMGQSVGDVLLSESRGDQEVAEHVAGLA